MSSFQTKKLDMIPSQSTLLNNAQRAKKVQVQFKLLLVMLFSFFARPPLGGALARSISCLHRAKSSP
jgi:hypothetical protein